MEQNYKLFRVRELADNDEEFILTLVETFLEEVAEDAERLKKGVAEVDYHTTYQAAHKMKPTIDLFELGILDTLIEVQDWGKFEKVGEDITTQLNVVITAVDNTIAELKEDYKL